MHIDRTHSNLISLLFSFIDHKSHVPAQPVSTTQQSPSDATVDQNNTPAEGSPYSHSPAITPEDPSCEDYMDLPTYMALIGQERDFVVDSEGETADSENLMGSGDGTVCIDRTEAEFESIRVKLETDSRTESGEEVAGDQSSVENADSDSELPTTESEAHSQQVETLERTDPELPTDPTVVTGITIGSPHAEGLLLMSSSGLRYIDVRPSDSDPYRGDEVLLIQSDIPEYVDHVNPVGTDLSFANRHDNNVKSSLENHGIGDADKTSTGAPALTQTKDDGSDDAMLSNSISHTPITDRPITPPHNVLQPETPPRGGFLGRSNKVIKRSSSVISDSGIESEPSSVACWPLDSRSGMAGARDPLQQQYLRSRRMAHRNSLEGLQTESHGSLPSATQASLTSISSLPYEDEEEERQRQLNTLTKSASAPQISSPDDNEDEEAVGQQRRNLKGNSEEDAEEAPSPEVGEEVFEDSQETAAATDVQEEESRLPDDNTGICACETECCEHKRAPESNTGSLNEDYDDISFHHIQLNELEDGELLENFPDASNDENQRSHDVASLSTKEKQRPADLTGLAANGKEQKGVEGQARVNKVPSSGLAFVNKKVVEVVNLSVSCAPTCLPFSSVLRDSPSVSGLSARQATSPITHQPLGSFGIISSSSSSLCTEQEISERMLK